jgi:DNA helicase-2/ATP-dependent DNA helicase PcrA
MDYTQSQKAAIANLGRPLLIIACAGSGKTQVISQRIIELLRAGVPPSAVVAFTYTDKAAAELKDRITALAEQQLGNIIGLAEMFVGTMHAFALDLLQTHVPDAFKYSVLNDVQARLFVDRHSRKSGLTTTEAFVQGQRKSLKRYQDSKLYLQVMSMLREDEVDFAKVPSDLEKALNSFRDLLAEKRHFDYTEILCAAVELLAGDEDDAQSGPLVRHLRDTVRYVVVDEYQDTNPVQERLITALCRFGANLCVVGDDDQTVYQWRGSAVSNILTFADRVHGVETITLDDNFRSSRGIVAFARSVAEQNAPDRLDKQMVATGHQQFERGDILALRFATPADEARWTCDRVERLRGVAFRDTPTSASRGLAYSDMAVLFRSVAHDADDLVHEMRHRNIPYVIKGLTRLFDTPEVVACVTSFRYVNREASADEVIDGWLRTDLGLTRDQLKRGLKILESARDWHPGERWSTYNLQRTYLDFLEAIGLREEAIPASGNAARGQLAFYNLGKFSQAISDFEQIYFQSEPQEKYRSFTGWLRYQAPNYYAESDEDVGYAKPDAVTIATVHQAKGMQWPAVFVPSLAANRFPGKRQGGLSVFHVIPVEAVPDADRYRGTEADERRLFYVALTRAQKYLALSFAPRGRLYSRASSFFDFATRNPFVLTSEPPGWAPERLEPRPLHEISNVTLSFSELKYLFDCAYQFKLRFLYGFNPPLHEALGYGKSLHDALAEVHKRALDGDIVDHSEVETLIGRHLHVPFAYPELRRQLRQSAVTALARYLDETKGTLDRTLYSEKQVQVHVSPGVVVDGRIDLIKRLDTNETCIVDFKSTERAQAEEVTRDQLHVYALGYEELTGERPDLVEVLNLDERASSTREMVNSQLLQDIQGKVQHAGDALRTNSLPKHASWCTACDRCDLVGLCRSRVQTGARKTRPGP